MRWATVGWLAAMALAVGCAGSPGSDGGWAPAAAPTAGTTADAAAPPGKAAGLVAPSTTAVAIGPPAVEPPCDRAQRWLADARRLHREGWIFRPQRLLGHARRSCPSVDDAALRAELERALTPAAGTTPASLETAARAALQAGDLEKARALSAPWLASSTAAGGAEPQRLFRPEGQRVVGVARDASAVIVATGDDFSRGTGRTSTLTVIDGTTGLPTRVIAAGALVRYAAVHGTAMLAVTDGGRIRLLSLDTGKPLRDLVWAEESYRWAAFTAGGARVVAVGEHRRDMVVRVFDVATGNNVGSVTQPDSREASTGCFLDDRRLLVLGGNELYVVDLSTVKVAAELDASPAARPGDSRPHWQNEVTAIAASPAGLVAAGSRRGLLTIWRLPDAKPLAVIEAGKEITALGLSADGTRVFVGLESGFRGEIRTYDMATQHALRARDSSEFVVFAQHGQRALVTGRRGGSLQLEDALGARMWPDLRGAWALSGMALSHGLAIAHERRETSESTIHFTAWYRGHLRELAAEGYRGDVFSLSPSGRRLAAIVSREAWLWDLATGGSDELSTPSGDGFPDGIVFGGETTLRAIFERPAETWSAPLPFTGWKAELAPKALDGFRGTALSSRGEAAILEDGKLVLASTGATLVPGGTAGFAFSGDGAYLFAGGEGKLLWFSSKGRTVGEKVLPCTPRHLAVDHAGNLAAFWCGDGLMTFRPPGGKLATSAAYGDSRNYLSVEAVRLSPSGRLVAVLHKTKVALLDGATLELRATLTLRDGKPLLETPAGRLMSWSPSPAWQQTVACRVGHRVLPFELCRDWLTDDALLDALLAQ